MTSNLPRRNSITQKSGEGRKERGGLMGWRRRERAAGEGEGRVGCKNVVMNGRGSGV